MKGINAIENANDPGKDGATGVNNSFAKDLTAFSLEYFNNDYKAINSSTPFASVDETSPAGTNSSQLFNGNIRYMQTRLTNPTTGVAMPMLNAYKYDQLNRLKESRSFENGLSANVWNPVGYNNEYFNSFNFDEMGNIENQIRYSRNGTLIDNLTYHYQKSNGKLVRNRLYHLNDAQTNTAAFTDDIDNMLTFNNTVEEINVFNNYNYDEEGRLVKDSAERISKIVWRVDGKVKEIQRATGDAKWLKFDYDAMGHRIAKHVYANNSSTLERSTYYVLDAQGNQISTYDHEVVSETAQFNLKERNIFGSSRIGSKQDSMNVLTATLSQNITQILGTKYYEFSNHLGNVLTVYSDVKIPLDTDNDNVVDEFGVPIRNIADYSPFGVQLNGRTVSGDFYRRGFNGMEKDDEVKGGGNSYDFGARMYDARVGRFLSLDAFTKKAPDSSPYIFAANTPISCIDNNGDSVLFYSESGKYLGVSHDNERYKNTNLVVIIKDSNVEAFKKEYNLKKYGNIEIPKSRKTETSRKAYREAVVAGLESMGQSFNVTAFVDFREDFMSKKSDANGNIVPYVPSIGPVEWSASLGNVPFNKLDKNISVSILSGTARTDNAPAYVEFANRTNGYGDYHIHSSGIVGNSLSPDDWDRARKVAENDKTSPFSIMVSDSGVHFYRYRYNGIDKSTLHPNPPIKSDYFKIDSNSFKNAKQ